jgi:hypothetical protein
MRTCLSLCLLLVVPTISFSATDPASVVLKAAAGKIRVKITRSDRKSDEVVEINDGGTWVPALSMSGLSTRVMAGEPGELQTCAVESLEEFNDPIRVVVRSDCSAGIVERTLTTTAEPDVISVAVVFTLKRGVTIHSVEDLYTFAPGRRNTETPQQGPLDFVWSQNLKNEPDGLVPQWSFKSPTVIFQQGKVFAALMPVLNGDAKPPLAIDLDVTSQAKPWFSYGRVPSESYGHSYFRRAPTAILNPEAGVIQYAYAIVASTQPPKLGYQRVVRRLWQTLGGPALLQSMDEQRNVRLPELALFDEWRQDAWRRYADTVYRDVDCPGGGCGTLNSDRNYMGDWGKPEEDAWFNSWFQSLRTVYGWYMYGRNIHDQEIQRKAESVLTLALKSPPHDGAFSTIYLVSEHRWIREDGWAGYPNYYHSFCMSWTAYWMLKWAEDLTPGRKDEVLAFTRNYGNFLLKHQSASGVIPSWYDSDFKPREEFRDLNAETAGSAFFLVELAQATGDKTYLNAAGRAMDFIARDVIPRQLWWDFETYRSCARKDFSFYDPVTAQYPQNNLSTLQAAMADLKLYRVTKDRKWLDAGTQVLDYLLLTQQVWNPPYFDPKLLGGFTTQNTDAEWSDARQGYAAALLWDYYKDTGNAEYLERAVAAARSTFAVAPWENWAHTGYINEPGSLTGFHWGTGSAMTSVEIMSAMLGDAFIDVARQQAVGFNASTLRNLKVSGHAIAFDVEALPNLKTLHIRFAGLTPSTIYWLAINKKRPVAIIGDQLARDGYSFQLGDGDIQQK